jgi:hypothetical protein
MESQTDTVATIQYPAAGQVVLSGRRAARYRGNQRYLADLYEQKKDWMLEPFRRRGQDLIVGNKKQTGPASMPGNGWTLPPWPRLTATLHSSANMRRRLRPD